MIMIVEDDKSTRELLQLLFQKRNDIVITSTIEETISALKKVRPKLILLDYLLNGEPSTIIIEYLNRVFTNPPPVIVMSAYPQADKELKGYAIEKLIKKPFDIEELEKLLSA